LKLIECNVRWSSHFLPIILGDHRLFLYPVKLGEGQLTNFWISAVSWPQILTINHNLNKNCNWFAAIHSPIRTRETRTQNSQTDKWRTFTAREHAHVKSRWLLLR
jgi:hypothetical protein